MQLRCFKCQMPIMLSRDAILSALDHLHDEDTNRYDVRCPKCRKVNRIPIEQLQHAAPNWTRNREESAE